MSAYKFTFKHDGDTMFDCFLTAYICSATNKNGTHCKKTTTIGTPYCYTHLLHLMHLKVKQSTIPNAGKGVFATDPKWPANAIIFKKNALIAPYGGEKLSSDEMVNRYDDLTAPYGMFVNKTKNIHRDAACERGIGSLINHKPGNRANVYYAPNYTNNTVNIKAARDIRNGHELFADYREDYNFNENTTYTTKMSKRE